MSRADYTLFVTELGELSPLCVFWPGQLGEAQPTAFALVISGKLNTRVPIYNPELAISPKELIYGI